MSEYIQIGYTQKTHGVAGELKLFIEERYWEDFLKNERLFIDVKGIKVPYFIETMRGKETPIVKFEDVDSKEAAFGLQSRGLFLRPEDLVPEDEREFEPAEDETLPFARVTGYTLIDATLGELGPIEDVFELPQQQMAVLRYQQREVLVPLHEQFIQSVDEAGKRLYVDLPEGLLEL